MARFTCLAPCAVLLTVAAHSLADIRYATDNGFFLEVTRDVAAR